MKKMWVLVPLVMLLVLSGCDGDVEIGPSDSDPGLPAFAFDDRDSGTDADGDADTELFEGQIGLLLDARRAAAYGHMPATATIEVDNSDLPGYPAVVHLGQYSFIGAFSLNVSELSSYEKHEYAKGVSFKVTLWNAEGQPILEKTLARTVLQANPNPTEIFTTDLADLRPELSLNESTEYFIQQVKNDGSTIDRGWRFKAGATRKVFTIQGDLSTQMAKPINESAKPFLYTFAEFKNDPGYYAIKSVEHNKFLMVSLQEQKQGNAGNGNAYKFKAKFLGLSPDKPNLQSVPDSWNHYKFKIEKERDGVYIIMAKMEQSGSGRDLPLRHLDGWGKPKGSGSGADPWGLTVDDSSTVYWWTGGRNVYADQARKTSPTRWRIVSSSIDWELRSAGAEVVQSVIPAPQIGVAYESDEHNCGSEDFVTTTGIERSTETTVYAEWSESLSTLSSETHTLGWEISVEVGSGVGPSYSASVSGEHSFYTENSRTTTTTTGQSTTETVTFASSKEITVPASRIVYIKASYETYDDISVGFVQRLQVRGSDRNTGEYLTGEEIRSQLETTQFNGVVTAVEDDMVEVSIRGTAIVSNLVKGRTAITESPLTCD